ncbi:MAG: VanZ family protein, partial [Synergistaceae bacterium]|nr:VanZ family protein [Synergistaceae bacterium]
SEGNAPLWLTNMELLRGVIHIFMFIPLSMAIYYALSHYVKSWPKAILAALVISCAFGLADEAIKMYLPQREFDFADWVLDVIGSIAGLILVIAGRLLFRALKRNKDDDDDE